MANYYFFSVAYVTLQVQRELYFDIKISLICGFIQEVLGLDKVSYFVGSKSLDNYNRL